MYKQPATSNKTIISPLETFLLALAFLVVLALLYPKGRLENQIISEKSNYDLTTTYLKNLMRLNPNDSHLVFALAKTLQEQQKDELAHNLLIALEKNPNKIIRDKATLFQLELNNKKLSQVKTNQEKEKINNDNKRLLKLVAKREIRDTKSNTTLYYTALALKEKETALQFNLNILNILQDIHAPRYLYWLKNAHYLADEIGDNSRDITLLKMLTIKDHNQSTLWLSALLPKIKGREDLGSLAKELNLKGEALAMIYSLNQEDIKASKTYLNLLNQAEDKRAKKSLLLKVITLLEANNKVKQAAKIASNYEDIFIDDSAMTTKLLKLYLAANRADLAQKLSLKILQTGDNL